MTRRSILSFFVLIICSCFVVEAQHKARINYNALYQAEKQAAEYDLEYGKLLIEQSTQAKHSRVEAIAAELALQLPEEARVQVIHLNQNMPASLVEKSEGK